MNRAGNPDTIKVKTINDIISQIVPDPSCKRSGCHGKGYTGIRVDGKQETVILCPCARFGESDYTRLHKQLITIQEEIKSLHVTVSIYIEVLRRHTFFGGIRRGWESVADKLKKISPSVLNRAHSECEPSESPSGRR